MATTVVTDVVWKIDFYKLTEPHHTGTLEYRNEEVARSTFQFMRDQANHNGCPVTLSLYSETTTVRTSVEEVY